ncbi:MAG: rRNA maturation RNase YbeY [Clostridia bacterium]|nr:rRNA maturation RNase YbeY [Clostridia bacterium]
MKINFYDVNLSYRCLIKKVIKRVLQRLAQSKKIEFSVSFVSEDQIQTLNREQRNCDAVTDVLSFPYLQLAPFQNVVATTDAQKNPHTNNVMLGELVICLPRAIQQSKELGHGIKREVAFLALHGFLHLCGFDHVQPDDEEQMMSVAESVLQFLKITR